MGRILRRTLPIFIATLVPVVPLTAQRNQQQHGNGTEIQIHVTYDNNQPAEGQIRVDLLNESGIPISQGFTSDDGRASLRVASQGVYLIRVSGQEIEDGADSVEVQPFDAMRVVFVHVKPKAAAVQSAARSAGGTVTSAAQLRVPPNARKCFDKGMAAWQNRDYQQAADQFEKAVLAYPQYDTAYNNLGVMYAHLNQPDKALAAFKRSVELNDKNADADRNLARMLMRQKGYPQAEELLKKSLAVQPTDVAALTMLAIAEIQDGKPDDALRDAQKVHTMTHDGYAVVHYVAGEALEQKHQPEEAKLEYTTYLRENPNGAEAEQVKSALGRLSNSSASAAPKSQ